ncbi:hypothetical protein NDU88_006987 [Pleurodeles waltl]|uniref:Uncharacterized protein n=1 Tax=Pleurodeles waltl TaxID=8319 RepID=A0AAV7PKB7_PLEWA|nr:hypothetical protein NDU88_006987 [Pleurodeles waltl]
MVLSLKQGNVAGYERLSQPRCEVRVAGKKLELMADSGSRWTIVTLDYFEQVFEGIWEKSDLKESDIVAESFEGGTIEVIGEGVVSKRSLVEVIVNAPAPDNREKLLSFTGLCEYYSKFIKIFATKLKPLRELIRKGVQYAWTGKQSDAFEMIKKEIVEVTVDASM